MLRNALKLWEGKCIIYEKGFTMNGKYIRGITLIALVALMTSCATDLYRKDPPLTTAYSKFIVVDGFKVHYYDLGPFDTDSGELPLVVIHGWMGSAYDYSRIITLLARKRRVIVPDLPGSGYTEDLGENESFNYDLDGFIRFLEDFTNELRVEKFVLMGHSMGGQLAIHFTKKYQNKISRLILIAPDGLEGEEGGWLLFSSWGFLVDIISVLNTRFFIATGLRLNVFYDKSRLTGKLVQSVAETSLGRRRWVQAEITKNIIGKNNVNSILQYIDVPTLILWGKNDRVLNVKWAEVFLKGIKNSRLFILEKCGHMPMYEKPMETAMYIEKFLLAPEIPGR